MVRAFPRTVAALAPKKGGFTVPQGPIMVGVQADPTAALQLRDIGPPAESVKAAAAFRQFWGDRAELRRFQVCLETCSEMLPVVMVVKTVIPAECVRTSAELAKAFVKCWQV